MTGLEWAFSLGYCTLVNNVTASVQVLCFRRFALCIQQGPLRQTIKKESGPTLSQTQIQTQSLNKPGKPRKMHHFMRYTSYTYPFQHVNVNTVQSRIIGN